MTFRQFLIFAYGFLMGTSTPFLKPAKRYLFPTAVLKIDDQLELLLGGSGICGVLHDARECVVINVNREDAAIALRKRVDEIAPNATKTVIVTALNADFAGGLSLFPDAAHVFHGAAEESEVRTAFGGSRARSETVAKETVLELAGERLRLIPMGPAAGGSDLAVFLEGRSVLFTGPQFFHRIHPILRVGPELDPAAWIENFLRLLDRLQPRTVVPAEGDLATALEAREFAAYLRDLRDPAVEFSSCRQRYDWMEIPGQTSLEENFNFLRENVRSHTTFR